MPPGVTQWGIPRGGDGCKVQHPKTRPAPGSTTVGMGSVPKSPPGVGISLPMFIKHQNSHFMALIAPSPGSAAAGERGHPPGWAQPQGRGVSGTLTACARVPSGTRQPPIGELLNYGVWPRNARANNDNGVNHRHQPSWPRGRENSSGEAGVGLGEATPGASHF